MLTILLICIIAGNMADNIAGNIVNNIADYSAILLAILPAILNEVLPRLNNIDSHLTVEIYKEIRFKYFFIIQSWLVEIYSKHSLSQTKKTSELRF